MSNVAYKTNTVPKRVHKEAEQPKKQILKRGKITLGEKILAGIAVAIVAVIAFQIISVQAAIYNVNKDIAKKDEKVAEQKKENDDLKMQVDKLSRYERILKKAKENGLKLDGGNVKVVDGK